MKKTFFIFLLLFAVAAYGLNRWHHKLAEPKLTPAEYIEQTHQAFPEPAPAPEETKQPDVQRRHVRPKAVRKHKHVVRPLPRPRPHVDQVQVDTLPPQAGRICIFPLSMIPECYPGPNADANRD